jgi:hypothetical protein
MIERTRAEWRGMARKRLPEWEKFLGLETAIAARRAKALYGSFTSEATYAYFACKEATGADTGAVEETMGEVN